MRLKDNYALRQVAQNWIVMPLAEETVNFSGMLKLNETGAMLWQVLEQDCSVDALTEKLMSEYKLSEAQARTDAEEFFNKLVQIGCMTED